MPLARTAWAWPELGAFEPGGIATFYQHPPPAKGRWWNAPQELMSSIPARSLTLSPGTTGFSTARPGMAILRAGPRVIGQPPSSFRQTESRVVPQAFTPTQPRGMWMAARCGPQGRWSIIAPCPPNRASFAPKPSS